MKNVRMSLGVMIFLLIFPISSYSGCPNCLFLGTCSNPTGVPIQGCIVSIPPYYTTSNTFGYWHRSVPPATYTVIITTPENCVKYEPSLYCGCGLYQQVDFSEPRYKIVGNEKRWRAGHYPSTTMDNYVNTIGWNCDFTSQEGDMVIE